MAKYNDPLVRGRADPYIYKHTDGFYYFTATYPSYDRICIRKSETINGLTTRPNARSGTSTRPV